LVSVEITYTQLPIGHLDLSRGTVQPNCADVTLRNYSLFDMST